MTLKRKIIQFVALYQIMSAFGVRRAFLKRYFLEQPSKKLFEKLTRNKK